MTIDINELRQALGAVQPEEVEELLDRLEAAEQTVKDYMRIDREKAQIAQRLEAAEKEQVLTMKLADRLALALNTSNHERDALRAELSKQQALTDAAQHIAEVAQSRADALRTKIEQMERQEPAYWGPKHAIEGGSTTVIVGKFPVNPTDAPLYALPGAKGEEK